MEKQTKIILGLAALGIAAYLIFKPRPAAAGQIVDPKNYTPTSNTYKFLQDVTLDYYSMGNKLSKTFKKGDYIEAAQSPYVDALQTTPTGMLPNFKLDGQYWITVPNNSVELVTKTPTGNDPIGTEIPVKAKLPCPSGTQEVQPNCFAAPCPSECVPIIPCDLDPNCIDERIYTPLSNVVMQEFAGW